MSECVSQRLLDKLRWLTTAGNFSKIPEVLNLFTEDELEVIVLLGQMAYKYRTATKNGNASATGTPGIVYWDMEEKADNMPYKTVSFSNRITELQAMLRFFSDADVGETYSEWVKRMGPGVDTLSLLEFASNITDKSGNIPYALSCRLLTKEGEVKTINAFGLRSLG